MIFLLNIDQVKFIDKDGCCDVKIFFAFPKVTFIVYQSTEKSHKGNTLFGVLVFI